VKRLWLGWRRLVGFAGLPLRFSYGFVGLALQFHFVLGFFLAPGTRAGDRQLVMAGGIARLELHVAFERGDSIGEFS